MSEDKEKSLGGRPTKYKTEYCQEIIDFFNREPFDVAVADGVALTDKYGKPVLMPCKLPTFEMFALSIGVHRETLINWCDANPEFFDAYKKAKDYQKEILIQNGLVGGYEKTFAIFTAKNVTDMRDRHEVGHTGAGGGALEVVTLTVEEYKKARAEMLAEDDC